MNAAKPKVRNPQNADLLRLNDCMLNLAVNKDTVNDIANQTISMFKFGIHVSIYNMDVSKNRGTPKWMVYNGKPY